MSFRSYMMWIFGLSLLWVMSAHGLSRCETGASGDYSSAPVLDLEQRIQTTLKNKSTSLLLPSGVYRVASTSSLFDVSNFHIIGNRTRLVFTNLDYAFVVYRSSNITFSCLEIDYDPLPFTQAIVTSKTKEDRGHVFNFRVLDGYPDLSSTTYSSNQPYVLTFVSGGIWKRNVFDQIYPQFLPTQSARVGMMKLNSPFDEVAVNDRLVLNSRDKGAFYLAYSSNVRLENVSILAAPGVAVLARFMDGDNYFRVSVTPGPRPKLATSERYISASADGINFAYFRKGPIIEWSTFDRLSDDGVNIFNSNAVTVGQFDSRTTLVARLSGGGGLTHVIRPGDNLRILRYGTFTPLVKGATVERFERGTLADARKLKANESEWLEWKKRAFAQEALKLNDENISFYRVTLKYPTPLDPARIYHIESDGDGASRYTVTNNRFINLRGSGIKAQASRGDITDNHFQGLSRSAIVIGPLLGRWREGTWARDVLVRKNFIDDVGYARDLRQPGFAYPGAIAVMVEPEVGYDARSMAAGNEDVKIHSNYISRSVLSGIFHGAAARAQLINNIIIGTACSYPERSHSVFRVVSVAEQNSGNMIEPCP